MRLTKSPVASWRRAASSVGIGGGEDDHRDDATGCLLLVLGELRYALDLCSIEPLALGAGGLAGGDVDRLGADLDLDVGVGHEVVVPVGVGRGPGLGGENDIAPTVALEGERVDAALAGPGARV